ncbi:hypothetical protein [Carnobacterium sp. TMP28]|uniref:hypothetical protein n=1 Tax=Carnobacterium sp. TMP28 TaxID=3397060 RepID=UPI0039E109F0
MKQGILIYQAPPMLGRNVMVDNYAFMNFSFMGIGKGKKFLEKLQMELVKLDYPVTVVKDDTEANLEDIIARQYDFIICVPGLQKKLLSKDKLPQVFHIDSQDYYSSSISKTITNIKNNVL